MNIGKTIKDRRLELDLSAEEIAAKLKVSPATMYRYENGDIKKMPTKIIIPLAEILKTTTTHLLGLEETQANTQQDKLVALISKLTDEECAKMTEYLNFIVSQRK